MRNTRLQTLIKKYGGKFGQYTGTNFNYDSRKAMGLLKEAGKQRFNEAEQKDDQDEIEDPS